MKSKKLLIVLAGFILGAGFYIASRIYQGQQTENLSFISKSNFEKFVPEYAPKLGTTNPKVYLVEFLDPECESCRDFYPMVKMLMDEFPGKIQLVIRYAPFHPNSKMAIKIIEAARKQGKYWQALEVLFHYQPEWGSHHHPKPELMWKYLPESGVDVAKIKVDMNDPEIEKMIEQELSDGQDLGVRGTPSFFVNGKPLEVFGLEPLRQLIQENLQD